MGLNNAKESFEKAKSAGTGKEKCSIAMKIYSQKGSKEAMRMKFKGQSEAVTLFLVKYTTR